MRRALSQLQLGGHYAGEGEALAPVAPCLHAACAQHSKLALAAATGQGSGRHLFALLAMAAEGCAQVSHSSKGEVVSSEQDEGFGSEMLVAHW